MVWNPVLRHAEAIGNVGGQLGENGPLQHTIGYGAHEEAPECGMFLRQ